MLLLSFRYRVRSRSCSRSDRIIVEYHMCAVNPIRLSLFLHWDELLQMLLKLCCSSCQQIKVVF